MKTLEFGILCLALLFIWKRMLKPVFRDFVRDKLFDCRADVRRHFMENEPEGLSHPAYRYLRDAINFRIRYIDDISLLSAKVVCNAIDANEALSKRIANKMTKEIEALNYDAEQLQRFMRRPSRWVTFYWIHSSLLTIVSFYFILITGFLYLKCKSVKDFYTQQVDKSFDDRRMQILDNGYSKPEFC